MDPIISIHINSLTFDSGPPALHHIDLSIGAGDFVAITGPVASGKSALLHCITGAIPKYYPAQLDGSVTVKGQDIAQIPLPKMADYLGYMTQDPQSQIVDITVYDDVAFGPGNMGLERDAMDQCVHHTLKDVGLVGFEDRSTHSLSGGQAQRVVLAGVLATGSSILVLDQPTAELDPQGRKAMYDHLGRLNRETKATIVVVMDRSDDILAHATTVVVMEDGTISTQLTPHAYQRHCSPPVPAFPTAVPSQETILSLAGAAYTYKGGQVGCQPIDLSVQRGECVAVVGLNGSGKTTLLKMMEGLLTPTAGTVSLFGETLTKKNLKAMRARMGFLFQNPDYQIFCDTVLSEVTFGLRLRKLPMADMDRLGHAALKKVGLDAYATLHPQRLSRGQRQLLALASVFITEPQLIIADEPTSGLDEGQSHTVMAALHTLSAEGRTVVLVTHDLVLAQAYTRRMVVMDRHAILSDFSMDEVAQHRAGLRKIGLVGEVNP